MSKAKTAPKSDSQKPSFEGRVILVHTTDANIIRALDNARIAEVGTETFLEGNLISPTPGHFDDGKLVRLNVRYVVSITEFDSVDQFMKRKKGDLKLLPQDRLV